MRRSNVLYWYVGAVSLTGVPLVAMAVLESLPAVRIPAFWVLFVLAVALDVLGARVPYMRQSRHIVPSVALSFGLLLVVGTGPAMVGIAAATAIANVVRGKAAYKIVFNAAQLALSTLAAGAVLTTRAGVPLLAPHALETEIIELSTISLAGLALFAANYALLIVFVWAGQSASLLASARAGLVAHTMPMMVMLSSGAIVAVVAEHRLSLIPLLLVPAAALYRSAQAFMNKEHEATHDGLTGLPHRGVFHDRLEQAITAAERSGSSVAVMIVDLDGFKEINDTLGHLVGDEILRLVARRMTSAVRADDTVARSGGDEFAVLLPTLSAAEDALAVVSHLQDSLEQPAHVAGRTIPLAASVGVAVYPHDGLVPEVLLGQADLAMYRAKRSRGAGRAESRAQDLTPDARPARHLMDTRVVPAKGT